MQRLLKFFLWPFQALVRPSAQSVQSLRRALYTCAVTGLLCSLPAAWWCLAHLVKLAPSLKRAMREPSETLLVLVLVGSVAPFLLAAVLQGASAFRVLRKLPDEMRLNMPGLGAMNAVAPVAYFVLSVVVALAVLNFVAIALLVVGFVVAIVLSVLYTMATFMTLDQIDPNKDMLDRIGQIFDICTSSRRFFELETWLFEAIAPPDWLITSLIVAAYAIPTVFAIVIWTSRRKLQAANGRP